jgi:hypothetical protein
MFYLKNMHINITINNNLRGLITYLKNYEENKFSSTLESTKNWSLKWT